MKNQATCLNGTIGSALPEPAKRPIRRWPHRVIAALREFNRIQRDYDRLLQMPDHVLEDIGLQRVQILKERRDHRNVVLRMIGR